MRRILCFLFLISGLSLSVLAQPRVDLWASYERVIAVVPIVGAGTAADPRRPLFVPAPPTVRAAAPDRSGIIAFSWVMADDGRSAIVEFVARDRGALTSTVSCAGTNATLSWQSSRPTCARFSADTRTISPAVWCINPEAEAGR
jgi:hypothetical protein